MFSLFQIEKALRDIEEVWATMRLMVEVFKDKSYRIKSTEELLQVLEEHVMTLSSMKSSQYYLPFSEKVDHWERTLASVGEVVELALAVQRSWMYLENIFIGTEDIRPHLPQESSWFDQINAGFLSILESFYKAQLAIPACCGRAGGSAALLAELTEYSAMLEKIQKSLEDYLEKKRQQFPRFYFLSNDDLLEILGQAKDPAQVQKHIKKCFEAIKQLEITPPSKERGQKVWEANGMISPDGENVSFKMTKNVVLEPPVEAWLNQVESRMRETLRKLLVVCHTENIAPKASGAQKKEKWVKTFPGQLLITSGQISWTTDCWVWSSSIRL